MRGILFYLFFTSIPLSPPLHLPGNIYKNNIYDMREGVYMEIFFMSNTNL